MNDIIREIDEELKAKRYKELAQKYGKYVVGVVMLIVAGFGGYGWQKNRTEQVQSGRAIAFSNLAGNASTSAEDWLQYAEAKNDAFSAVALQFAAAYYLQTDNKDYTTATQIMQRLSSQSKGQYKDIAEINGQIAAMNNGETLPSMQAADESPFSAFAALAEAERLLKLGDKQAAIALLESQDASINSAEQAIFFELANALKSIN